MCYNPIDNSYHIQEERFTNRLKEATSQSRVTERGNGNWNLTLAARFELLSPFALTTCS